MRAEFSDRNEPAARLGAAAPVVRRACHGLSPKSHAIAGFVPRCENACSDLLRLASRILFPAFHGKAFPWGNVRTHRGRGAIRYQPGELSSPRHPALDEPSRGAGQALQAVSGSDGCRHLISPLA